MLQHAENVEITIMNNLNNDTKLMAEELYTKIYKAIQESKIFLSCSGKY